MEKAATLIFYRPYKEASKDVKIIVGTIDPNEVIAELKNGCKVTLQYQHFGKREFIAGIYSAGKERLKTTIKHGEIYCFKCQVGAVAFELTAQIVQMEYEKIKEELSALSLSI